LLLAAPTLAWARPVRADAPGLGLEQALSRAAEHAPESRVARAGVGIARADLLTTEMLPNPTITAAVARAEPVFTAGLAFRLPYLGQRQAAVRAMERNVTQAEAQTAFELWRIRHDARLIYYAAVRARDELGIAEEVERLTRRVADMAEERFAAGAGNRLEREQAALVHVRAEQDVSDRRAAAAVARLSLARLVGVDPTKLPDLRDQLHTVGPTPSADTLLAEAKAGHPEIAELGRERDAALARASLGRWERVPVPTLELAADALNTSCMQSGSMVTTSGISCWGPRATLSFDLPILNFNSGPIARAEAEVVLIELKMEAAERRIETEIRAAHSTFDAAVVRARFFDERYVPAADQVAAMAQEGFSEGRTGLLPLLEAERSVLEARLGRADALFQLQAARADLEESSGVQLSAP
jgi:cobalt-zinc-cadmium efflux system outer membrane protein